MDQVATLEFVNLAFKDGMNVTVRNGDKWLHRVKPGDRVLLAETGKAPLWDAQNRVLGVLYGSLDEIPSAVLKFEHDPACRTKKGLARVLDEIYGPAPHNHRMVTVIMWVRDTRQGAGPWGSD